MATPLSPDAFYESARGFAQAALRAHHARDYRRVALEAGTALEHLLKACLARRSPALLVDLRNENGFSSLLQLLGIPGLVSVRSLQRGQPTVPRLRTVGLRDALYRVKMLVTSGASYGDLETLIGMRDGTVHAALDDEVEQRLLVAFALHTFALIWDLHRRPEEFWGEYFPTVDMLVTVMNDEVEHRVEVRIAAARAEFAQQYSQMSDEIRGLMRRWAEQQSYRENQRSVQCPACESRGVSNGEHEVTWEPEWEGDEIVNASATVWFKADEFSCRVCGLRLDSAAELEAAGMESRFEIEGVDPRDFEPRFDYEAYDVRREELAERGEWRPNRGDS